MNERNDKMTLAEKIALLRKQKGWSQEELADKMDISRQSVSKWESAQSVPDLDKIIKITQTSHLNKCLCTLKIQ